MRDWNTILKRHVRFFIVLTAVLLFSHTGSTSEQAQVDSLRGIASVWVHIKDDTGGLIDQGQIMGGIRLRLREQGLRLAGVSADAQLQVRFSSIVVGNQGGQFLYVFVVHLEAFQLATLVRLQADTGIPPRLVSTWSKTLFSFRIGDEATLKAILKAASSLLEQFLADYATANADTP